jgi:hypothetical protein
MIKLPGIKDIKTWLQPTSIAKKDIDYEKIKEEEDKEKAWEILVNRRKQEAPISSEKSLTSKQSTNTVDSNAKNTISKATIWIKPKDKGSGNGLLNNNMPDWKDAMAIENELLKERIIELEAKNKLLISERVDAISKNLEYTPSKESKLSIDHSIPIDNKPSTQSSNSEPEIDYVAMYNNVDKSYDVDYTIPYTMSEEYEPSGNKTLSKSSTNAKSTKASITSNTKAKVLEPSVQSSTVLDNEQSMPSPEDYFAMDNQEYDYEANNMPFDDEEEDIKPTTHCEYSVDTSDHQQRIDIENSIKSVSDSMESSVSTKEYTIDYTAIHSESTTNISLDKDESMPTTHTSANISRSIESSVTHTLDYTDINSSEHTDTMTDKGTSIGGDSTNEQSIV